MRWRLVKRPSERSIFWKKKSVQFRAGGSGGGGLKVESVSWERVELSSEFAVTEELMFGEKVT